MTDAGDIAADLGSRLANKTLGNEDWARAMLARHAGRTFSVKVGPLASRFRIGEKGELGGATAESGSLPDLELFVSPLALPALVADPSRWNRLVVATGDTALAETLRSLAQTLPWFVERAFARALGPIAGQRAADAGRALLAFPDYAAARLAESVGSYVRDEADLLVPGVEARTFGEQVASVAQRTDELSERLDRLDQGFAAADRKPIPFSRSKPVG